MIAAAFRGGRSLSQAARAEIAPIAGKDHVMRRVIRAGVFALFPIFLGSALSAATVEMQVRPQPRTLLPESLRVTAESPLDQYESALRARVEARPGDAASWRDLGTVLFHKGAREDAVEAWARAAELDETMTPPDVMSDVQQVFALERTGDRDAAAALLAQLSERRGDDAHFLLIRAEQAMRGRNYAAAEADYARAYERAPALFLTSLNLARFYEFTNRQDRARAFYEAATEAAPDRAVVWDYLARHQFSAGDATGALASLRRAEATDPGYPLAEVRLAELFAGRGDHLGARRWYRLALNRATAGLGPIRVALSDAQLRLGLLDEARETLDAVLAEEASGPVLVARGYVDEALGDLDAAAARYLEAIKVDPGNVVAANNLAMVLIKLDRSADEALVHAGYAVEARPDNGAIFGTHALALAHSGDWARALPELRKAVRISPDDPWLRFFLGKALIEDGDLSEAQYHLDSVLILAPDFPRRAEVEALASRL
jgi:tetratricopeptide (TPR) repeat protein